MPADTPVGHDPDRKFGSEASLRDLFARQGWLFSIEDDGRLGAFPVGKRWSDPFDTLHMARSAEDAGRLNVDFLGLVGAEVSRGDRTIRVCPLVPGQSWSTFEHFALDVLLPRVIAEDGDLVLHGALVARGKDAVCIVGESGRGKSTLSAALRNAGWDFHGDDALRIRADDDGFLAQATYASLRLYPDSLQQLYPERPSGLSQVADYLDKLRLDPADHVSEWTAAPRLRAIVLLGEDDESCRIRTTPLATSRLCMALIGQSFALDPADPAGARRRLSAASAIAAGVPAVELVYPRDYAQLPQVVDMIGSILDNSRSAANGRQAAQGVR